MNFNILISQYVLLLVLIVGETNAQFYQSKVGVAFDANQFRSVTNVAVDANGNIFVLDRSDNKIKKFDSSLAPITQWGGPGKGDGKFNYPKGITIDSNNDVLIVDTNNHRIQRFDNNGVFLTAWGGLGSGDGQLWFPSDIAIDANGFIYITDTGNNRVQKFTNAGIFEKKWGSFGSGPQQFNQPAGIAVDSNNDIFVTDAGNNRIQKFNVDIFPIETWGVAGTGNKMFNGPSGIAIDGNDYVYVVDTNNNRIQRFTNTGGYDTQWGSFGAGNGQVSYPSDIDIDAAGNIYVADLGNLRVQKFTSARAYSAKVASAPIKDGQLGAVRAVAPDGNGNVYIVDSENNRVQKFSDTGVLLAKWGSLGNGDLQFNHPWGIAVDGSQNVYVVDFNNYRIMKFNSSGGFIRKWGSYGTGAGQFFGHRGIAVDKQGNVYVADTQNHRIQKFNSDGVHQKSWGGLGFTNGLFYWPEGIAVDPDGFVYVCDTENHRIQKFSDDGEFIATWGPAQGAGLSYPRNISINARGDIFILDNSNPISQFTTDGVMVTKWNKPGNEEGQLSASSCMAADNNGGLYIGDIARYWVQKFGCLMIHSLSAKKAEKGTAITITGANFSPTPSDNIVQFNDGVTTVTAASPTELKVIVPNIGSTGYLTITREGFTAKTPESFIVLPLSISGVQPNVGIADEPIKITGFGFSAVKEHNIVKFNGIPATVTSSSYTTITATLPAGMTIGKVSVTIHGETATSADDFGGTLSLTSFSPGNGEIGASVVLTGTGFSPTLAENIVTFNGTAAVVTGRTETTLTVEVPVGGTTGKIKVTRGTASLELPIEFLVLPLAVTSFSPPIGAAGTQITVAGSGFSSVPENNLVKFNGISSTVSEASPTSLKVVVPAGNSIGKISVTVRGVTASSTSTFEGELSIKSFEPLSASVAAPLTIKGTGFSTTPSDQIVRINGVDATVIKSSPTSLTVTVPSTVTGPIEIERENVIVKSVKELLVLPLIIESFNPGVSAWGDAVTLRGHGFSSIKENNLVKFNGIEATVTSSSPTVLVVTVPPNSTDGKISITIADKTFICESDFIVTPLDITEEVYQRFYLVGGPSPKANVSINDINAVQSIKLNSVGISAADQSAITVDNLPLGATNTMVFDIPVARFNDPIGIRCWFTMTDSRGNEIESAGSHIYLRFNDKDQMIPGLINGKTVSAYQMIAVPTKLDNNVLNRVFDELGEYDDSKWRVFFNFEGKNIEKPGTIVPGVGYWFIQRNPHEISPGSGSTVEVTHASPFELELPKGSSLIGNPYNFSISTEDIEQANQLPKGSFKFRQFINGTYTESSPFLQAYRGAFVYANEAMTIKIPTVNRGASGGGGARTVSPLDADAWEVNLKIQEGSIGNELFGIGMHPTADESQITDIWDGVNLPMLDGMVSYDMAFRRIQDESLSKDIVPTATNYTWEASLSNDNAITLSWANDYFGANDRNLVLEVSSLVEIIDMRRYNELVIRPGNHIVRFHYGDASYIKSQTLENNLRLGGIYPNPFDRTLQTLSVVTSLPEGTNAVALHLKDVVGNNVVSSPVSQYEGGRKSIEWTGDFSICSPGIYVVQIEIKDSNGKTLRAHRKIVFK